MLPRLINRYSQNPTSKNKIIFVLLISPIRLWFFQPFPPLRTRVIWHQYIWVEPSPVFLDYFHNYIVLSVFKFHLYSAYLFLNLIHSYAYRREVFLGFKWAKIMDVNHEVIIKPAYYFTHLSYKCYHIEVWDLSTSCSSTSRKFGLVGGIG